MQVPDVKMVLLYKNAGHFDVLLSQKLFIPLAQQSQSEVSAERGVRIFIYQRNASLL